MTFQACIVLLSFVPTQFPDTTIKVVHGKTKGPIKGARVFIDRVNGDELDRGTTDDDGLFVSNKVDPTIGRIVVTVKALGNVEDDEVSWTSKPIVFQISPKRSHEQSRIEAEPFFYSGTWWCRDDQLNGWWYTDASREYWILHGTHGSVKQPIDWPKSRRCEVTPRGESATVYCVPICCP